MEFVERFLLEASHVDREAHFARNHGDRGRFARLQNAHGKDEVLPGGQEFVPGGVHFGKEMRGGHHRVVAVFLVDGARVRGFAETHDVLVADVPADPRDDAHARRFAARQRRALFDVEFHEGADLLHFDDGFARRKAFGVDPRRTDRVGERSRLRAVAKSEVRGLQAAEHAERPHVGLPEEGTFFAAHHEDAVVDRGDDAFVVHVLGGDQGRDDARETVEVAALRDAVDVASGHEGGTRRIAPLHRHPDVPRRVGFDFETELAAFVLQKFKDLRFHGAVTLTGHAAHVRAHFADRIEESTGKILRCGRKRHLHLLRLVRTRRGPHFSQA